MLDPCNSFLDSEPEVCVEIHEGIEELVEGELDITGTLFATLLSEDTSRGNTDIFPEIMSSTSDSDSDDFLDNYLSKTQESLMKQVSDLHDSARKPRACNEPVVSSETKIKSSKEAVYSRPPLMCSSTVNLKCPKVEIERLHVDSFEKGNSFKKPDKCMNKNAVIARENREKKKQFVKHLENSLEETKLENFNLKSKLESKSTQCDSMQKEIKYLRSVLANQSCISALLKNIHATKGVAFTSSLDESVETNKDINAKKRLLDENDNYENTPKGIYVRATGSHKKIKTDAEKSVPDVYSPPPTPCSSQDEDDVAGGVCLHVSNNKVSLELCSVCAESASNAWNKAAMIDVAVKEKTVKASDKVNR